MLPRARGTVGMAVLGAVAALAPGCTAPAARHPAAAAALRYDRALGELDLLTIWSSLAGAREAPWWPLAASTGMVVHATAQLDAAVRRRLGGYEPLTGDGAARLAGFREQWAHVARPESIAPGRRLSVRRVQLDGLRATVEVQWTAATGGRAWHTHQLVRRRDDWLVIESPAYYEAMMRWHRALAAREGGEGALIAKQRRWASERLLLAAEIATGVLRDPRAIDAALAALDWADSGSHGLAPAGAAGPPAIAAAELAEAFATDRAAAFTRYGGHAIVVTGVYADGVTEEHLFGERPPPGAKPAPVPDLPEGMHKGAGYGTALFLQAGPDRPAVICSLAELRGLADLRLGATVSLRGVIDRVDDDGSVVLRDCVRAP